MNSKFYCIVFILCLSCNEILKQDVIIIDNETESLTNNSTESVESSIIELNENEDNEIIEDCIFDQATQTDEFLKDIEELDGYVWNQETKTAEIVLNNHWNLILKRGGCDHFEISATFIHDGELSFEKDRSIINKNIIWIVGLLQDFNDSRTIKDAIENNRISITYEGKNQLYINFMDFKVYESYFMYFESEYNSTKFSISNFIG